MSCQFCKVRTKKGQKYLYCQCHRHVITYNDCHDCLDKSFKSMTGLKVNKPLTSKSSVKKVSRYRQSVSDKVYDFVLSRCQNKCSLCGSSGPLQLHHIHGRSKTRTNDVDNCVMLCASCHLEKVHKNQKLYRPILDDIVKKQNEYIKAKEGN